MTQPKVKALSSSSSIADGSDCASPNHHRGKQKWRRRRRQARQSTSFAGSAASKTAITTAQNELRGHPRANLGASFVWSALATATVGATALFTTGVVADSLTANSDLDGDKNDPQLLEHYASSTASGSGSHHLMHQRHHALNSDSAISAAASGGGGSSSLSNTVRRISLNILNSSTAALAEHNGNFRSASAAGSYHSMSGGNDHHHDHSDHQHHEHLSSASASSSSPPSSGATVAPLTTTYSYLADLFPRLLSSSSKSSASSSGEDVSAANGLGDYIIDDYDTLDSTGGSEALLGGSGTTVSSLVAAVSGGGGGGVETTTSSSLGSSVAPSSSSSSSDMFMRLMRNVISSGTSSEETGSSSYSSSPSPFELIADNSVSSSSSDSILRSHPHGSGSSGGSGLFPSHLLSDPVVLATSSSSSSPSSSSPVSSLLSIPSSLLSSSSSSSSSAASSTPSTALLLFDDPGEGGARGSGIDPSSSSSRYHDFLQLFSSSSSAHSHNALLHYRSSSLTNSTLPVAFSALTSSQLVAPSYGSPLVSSYSDSSLEHDLGGSDNGSYISSTIASTISSATSSAFNSIAGSSSSYYASELSSSFSTIMDDYGNGGNGLSSTIASATSTTMGIIPPTPFVYNNWFDILILVLKIVVLGSIILSAILGNLLVIISVLRHHRLRITTNYFIVSLALADILVAVFAMTFNASVIFTGYWVFPGWVCDFWNCCDVLFSTASIMHLSCISYDRYYAIIKPLDYPMKITTKRVYIMIGAVWLSSVLISSIPVFTGLYTTEEAIAERALNPYNCSFDVNIPYSLLSSSVSFWVPCSIMVVAYVKIFKEATKQEKFIYRTQQMANQNNYHHHHHHHQQQHSTQMTTTSTTANNNNVTATSETNMSSNNGEKANNTSKKADEKAKKDAKSSKDKNKGKSSDTQHLNAPRHSSASENNVIQIQSGGHRNSHAEDPESGSSTPTKRTISKMKREHKAAKTLGIIMGAFIACWFPFFVWYVVSTIINWRAPKFFVDLLFWVGYLNSAMNPIIYAYFNREFREAFKETLRNLICCCLHLKCLEQQRSDAISFS